MKSYKITLNVEQTINAYNENDALNLFWEYLNQNEQRLTVVERIENEN